MGRDPKLKSRMVMVVEKTASMYLAPHGYEYEWSLWWTSYFGGGFMSTIHFLRGLLGPSVVPVCRFFGGVGSLLKWTTDNKPGALILTSQIWRT